MNDTISASQLALEADVAQLPPCSFVRGLSEKCPDAAAWRLIFGCDTHEHTRVTLACERHHLTAARVVYPASLWQRTGRKPVCSGTWSMVVMEPIA